MASKRTNPGQYRHFATFERPTRTTDDAGQRIKNWEVVDEGYVALRTLTTGEVARNKLAAIETSHEVRMRYRDDITTEWRIVIGGECRRRVLDIVGITNLDECDVELVIRAMERGT